MVNTPSRGVSKWKEQRLKKERENRKVFGQKWCEEKEREDNFYKKWGIVWCAVLGLLFESFSYGNKARVSEKDYQDKKANNTYTTQQAKEKDNIYVYFESREDLERLMKIGAEERSDLINRVRDYMPFMEPETQFSPTSFVERKFNETRITELQGKISELEETAEVKNYQKDKRVSGLFSKGWKSLAILNMLYLAYATRYRKPK